jgi:hypothetical protein
VALPLSGSFEAGRVPTTLSAEAAVGGSGGPVALSGWWDVGVQCAIGFQQPRWQRHGVQRAGIVGALPHWAAGVRARGAMRLQDEGLQMDIMEQWAARMEVPQVLEG